MIFLIINTTQMKRLQQNELRPFILICILALFIWLLPGCKPDIPVPAPVDLICEYEDNPVGIDRLNPQFSWKIPSYRNGIMQTAYQILVSSSITNLDNNQGDVWSSGKVASDQSTFVDFAGHDLKSKKIYYWKVKYWDNDGGENPYREPARF